MAEPVNLRRWHRGDQQKREQGQLFTCGRPGRGASGYGTARKPVDVSVIVEWVNGLPQAEVLHIVSLLGCKKDGYSEFAYYPFRSALEAGSRPTFQEWLHSHFERRIVVHEFPTTDAQGIRRDVLASVTDRIRTLLRNHSTVVLIDSAGAERTKRVCEALGYFVKRSECRFSDFK